jgi:hypothetical protein
MSPSNTERRATGWEWDGGAIGWTGRISDSISSTESTSPD